MRKKLKLSGLFAVAIVAVGSMLFLVQTNNQAEASSAELSQSKILEKSDNEISVMNDLGLQSDEMNVTEEDDGSIIVSEGYTDLTEEEHEQMREKMNDNYEKLEEQIDNGELEGVTIGKGE